MNTRLILALSVLLTLVACKKKVPVESPRAFDPGPEVVTPKTETPAEQIARNLARVGFEFDSAALTSDAKQALDENARIMAEFQQFRIQVQGHCDERGTTGYNLALGDQRAAAVRKYLIAAGVAPSRIDTVSYGEEKPLSSGEGEVVWAQNRRAEFLVTGGDSSPVSGSVR